MSTAETVAKLREIIRAAGINASGLDTATESTPLRDLGIDSLAMLDVLYDVQQAFGVELDPESLDPAATVGDIARKLSGG